MTARIPFLEPGEPWPPHDFLERADTYRVYDDYFSRAELVALNHSGDPEKHWEKIVAAYPALITDTFASMLFGEPPLLTVDRLPGDGEDEEADEPDDDQRRIETIAQESDLETLNLEQAVDSMVLGDCAYKARREANGQVVIEAVDPALLHVHVDPFNVRRVIAWVIASVVDDPRGLRGIDGFKGRKCLRAEIHERGTITHRLIEINEVGRLSFPVDFLQAYGTWEDSGLTPEQANPNGQPTNVDDFLIAHVPHRRRRRRVWGRSVFSGKETMFRLLEQRAAKIAQILNKHAQPKMAVPPGLLDERGNIGRSSFDGMIFEVHPVAGSEKGLLVPQYVTWEGQLEGAVADKDWLERAILTLHRVAPQLVNLAFGTGFAESGTALRFRLLGTLAEVRRIQAYFGTALRRIMRVAAILDGASSDIRIGVEWKDGLPPDPKEDAEVEDIRLGRAAKTTTLTRSIKRLDGVTEREAKMRAEEIAADSREAFQSAQAGVAADTRAGLDSLRFDDEDAEPEA